MGGVSQGGPSAQFHKPAANQQSNHPTTTTPSGRGYHKGVQPQLNRQHKQRNNRHNAPRAGGATRGFNHPPINQQAEPAMPQFTPPIAPTYRHPRHNKITPRHRLPSPTIYPSHNPGNYLLPIAPGRGVSKGSNLPDFINQPLLITEGRRSITPCRSSIPAAFYSQPAAHELKNSRRSGPIPIGGRSPSKAAAPSFRAATIDSVSKYYLRGLPLPNAVPNWDHLVFPFPSSASKLRVAKALLRPASSSGEPVITGVLPSHPRPHSRPSLPCNPSSATPAISPWGRPTQYVHRQPRTPPQALKRLPAHPRLGGGATLGSSPTIQPAHRHQSPSTSHTDTRHHRDSQ